MGQSIPDTKQGHWILAKLGKKVLRPGGKELTRCMIEQLAISPEDDVVEFAPGMGFTASLVLNKKPHTYTGVELNDQVANRLKKTINGNGREIVVGNAAQSGLTAEAYNKVYGEAMLTMHADHRKSEIIREAYRLLKKGGCYGIHELALQPEDISTEKKAAIQKELSQSIMVNARPLTREEWSQLLAREGFKVIRINTNPMALLERKRLLDDEGFFRTLKITCNMLLHPAERRRVLEMKRVFRKYQDNLQAVCIVAEKV